MPNKFASPSPRLALFCLCFLFVVSAACNRGTSQPSATVQSGTRRYSLKGKVISVYKEAGMAVIDNEAVPGFMVAMIMPYIIKPASALNQLQPGDSITADVIIESDRYWLENVKVTGHSQTPADKPAAALHIPVPREQVVTCLRLDNALLRLRLQQRFPWCSYPAGQLPPAAHHLRSVAWQGFRRTPHHVLHRTKCCQSTRRL
ncbi:MAG: copper-binding protein [Candidatus Sulfotelmatobacter sp.]